MSVNKYIYLLFVLYSATSLSEIETREEFDEILNNFELRLSPYTFAEFGQFTTATGDWNQAYSERSAGGSFYYPSVNGQRYWGVNITGWLAKLPMISADEVDLILCHELGHHIHGGGKERLADYFATNTCLHYLWDWQIHEDFYTNESVLQLSQSIRESCEATEVKGYCHRSMIAGKHINDFRKWIWEKRNFQVNIETTIQCSEMAFISGVLDEEFEGMGNGRTPFHHWFEWWGRKRPFNRNCPHRVVMLHSTGWTQIQQL